jgi:rhodanese-related sulfurtransferase
MRQITALQLQSMLSMSAEERPLLLDVRESWEWQLAHIEGARHLPMGQVPGTVEQIDRTHPTVVICHHGMRSLQVIAFLQRQGFDNLHNLEGGIDAWSREVDPQIALY